LAPEDRKADRELQCTLETCNAKTHLKHFGLLQRHFFVNSAAVGMAPGVNPTTVSYNASVVKIYNATSNLVRFKNKNTFFYFEKMVLPTTTLAL
jgi:hypothetical protein